MIITEPLATFSSTCDSLILIRFESMIPFESDSGRSIIIIIMQDKIVELSIRLIIII